MPPPPNAVPGPACPTCPPQGRLCRYVYLFLLLKWLYKVLLQVFVTSCSPLIYPRISHYTFHRELCTSLELQGRFLSLMRLISELIVMCSLETIQMSCIWNIFEIFVVCLFCMKALFWLEYITIFLGKIVHKITMDTCLHISFQRHTLLSAHS